jgi:excisionase family DNA binding protein
MTEKLLTTGQAAKLCSVTSDTVLKWIRSGRLEASRTPGGHHRVSLENLLKILDSNQGVTLENSQIEIKSLKPNRHPFRYCWEFNNDGTRLNGCSECIVYTMRAKRCYEVVERAKEIGHNKLFCKQTCQECNYYQVVHQQSANVLFVTDNESLAKTLKKDAQKLDLNFEVTSCEYTTSTLVDAFRPDYAIVDCSLGEQLTKDICDHLIADPRIPFIRVVLAATDDEVPRECDKEIFARMEKPIDITDVAECIRFDWEDSALNA